MREYGSMWLENKYVKSVISLILSGINIYLAASLEPWVKSEALLPVLIFGCAGTVAGYLLIRRFLGQKEKRLRRHSLLWGAFMAAAYVLGRRLERDGTVIAGLRNLPELLLQICCLTVLTAACVSCVLCGGEILRSERFAQRMRRRQEKLDIFLTLMILLCWLPVFLAYYPSVFAYDAEGQLYQVIAHDYSTHHPLLHTLYLGAFFELGGKLLHSYSAGMAVHSVVQMILMAAAFGYTLSYLNRRGVPIYLRIALALFYALFPANSILAISTTKDVLFAALVLLYTLALHSSIMKRKCNAVYVIWAALVLLFRNNAVYAMILSVPCVCLLLGREKEEKAGLRKQYLICSGMAILVFAVGGMALKAATGAQDGSPREMLSVPLQQMARTRVVAEDTLSDEMKQELDRYLSSEWVMAAYDPHLADPVKNRAVIHDDPVGLIKTWIKLGLQHPQIYIDAFLDNSIGYWFVQDRSHAQIYGIGTESGFGYLSTDNRTMPAGCEIVEHSYLPAVREGMERIVSDNVYQRLPVVRLIFAPAFYWWMLCMYIAAVIYRRRYELLIPVMFLICYYMTLLLSPTVLIRYMYPFVVTVPAISCLISVDLVGDKSKNIQ